MSQTRVQWAAFVLRVGLGALMLAHGLTKAFVFTLPGTAAFFESVGFPGFLAYPVTAVEIGGGILLVLGLATQWAALATVPVLLGAVTVHFGNGWVFNAPGGGWEFPLFLVVVALAQFTLGTDGALSLGARLRASRPRSESGAVISAA